MSLFRDTAWSGMGAVVSTGSRFLVTIILVRLLTPAAYGDFIFAQWVVDLLFLICSFGLPGALTRFLPALSSSQDWARLRISRLFFAAAAGSVLLALGLFAAYLIAGDRRPTEVASLLFFAAGYLLASGLSPLLQGLLNFRAVVAGNVAFAIAAPLLLLAAMRTPTVGSAALALGGAWVLSSAASVTVAKLGRGAARIGSGISVPPDISTVAGYAANVWIVALISSLVWSRGELGVLKLNVDSRQIAIYAAALSLIGLVSQGAALLTGALTPHLVRKWQAGDTEGIRTVLRMITQAALMVTTVSALLLAGAGEYIVPLVLGVQYDESFNILLILSISTIAISSGCGSTLLQIQTNGKFGLFVNLMALGVLLVMSLCLTPLVGIAGAAYARVAAQAVAAMTTFYRLGKVSGMERTSKDLAVAFVISLLGLAAFYVFHTLAEPRLIQSLIVAGLLGGALVGATRLIVGVPLLSFLRAAR